jgi:branched-chain amino acid transport system substrate-binding protein
MKNSLRWLAAIAAATLSAPSLAAETVRIGGAFSITGNAAAYGAQQKFGVQAAIEDVNKSEAFKKAGVTLEMILEDDHTDPQQAINVFQQFINKNKVSAIIGPTLTNTAKAADPIAQQMKTPVVAVSNTAPKGITDIGDYIWRVSLTEAQVIPISFKAAQAKFGFKNVAILYGSDDAFTKAGFDVMKATVEAAGLPIVDVQSFATKDRDFNAQLTALKAKNPDFLMVSALVEQAAAILIQARQLGWNVRIMGGNGLNSPKLMQIAGPAAEGVVVGTAWFKASTDPVNQAFIAGQKARGNDPDQFCAQAYTGVLVIADAIVQSGMKGGRDDIKAGFAKVKDLPTPLGKFSFLPNRDGNHPVTVQIVKDGKFVVFQ